MDKEIAIDGNTALEDVVHDAEASGGTLVLTKDGQPVATLVPTKPRNIEAALAAAVRIRESRKIDLGGETIKELINAGRKY